MRELHELSTFKRDLKRIKKSGKYTIDDIYNVVELLLADTSLPAQVRDHVLSGSWATIGARECHIKPDLLLIYTKPKDRLYLVRLGSHSDLFG